MKALFELLKPDVAMSALVPSAPASGPAYDWVAAQSKAFSPEVQAGLWLYVDDLNSSHILSQGIESATGAYWHGIMHRREGDFSNAKYWFRQAGRHEVIETLGYDPYDFIDECERRHTTNPDDLVGLQRREWSALMDYCHNLSR
jgi:hypothetical protein